MPAHAGNPPRKPMSKTYLFVYGTLKRGYCRAHHLDGSEYVGKAVTEPRYRIYDCGEYPGMVEVAEGLAVEGELYRVDVSRLPSLDDVEFVADGLYRRGEVMLDFPPSAKSAQCYFYLPAVDGMRDCGVRW
jgi:gamma-glutamylcyclotransferase (GGCT)/AIG2-like uncharacterized protein YtfP